MTLALFLLISAGMAFSISALKIGSRLRILASRIGWPSMRLHWIGETGEDVTDRAPFLKTLVNCAPCTSFWCGIVVSLFVVSPSFPVLDLGLSASWAPLPQWSAPVLDGFAAVCFTFVVQLGLSLLYAAEDFIGLCRKWTA